MLHIQHQGPVTSCSKGAQGLSVLVRVTGIFTGTSDSLSPPRRQRPDRFAFRAGRNLPDKEFRSRLLLSDAVRILLTLEGGRPAISVGVPMSPWGSDYIFNSAFRPSARRAVSEGAPSRRAFPADCPHPTRFHFDDEVAEDTRGFQHIAGFY